MTNPGQSRLYAAVLAFAAAVFAALAGAVLFLETADRLDVRFVTWVHATAPSALVDTMRVLTYLGSAAVLGPLAIVTGLLLVRRRRPAAALFVVVAFTGSQVVDQVLKALFRRGRPELDSVVQLTTYAFPSGHAFGATATYGALALVLASTTAERRRRVALIAGAVALVLLVAASRMIVGAHFLLDVSAGIAGGVALLSALLLFFERARRPVLRVGLSWQEQPQSTGLDP